MITDRWNSLLK